jgi:hypothetical protein
VLILGSCVDTMGSCVDTGQLGSSQACPDELVTREVYSRTIGCRVLSDVLLADAYSRFSASDALLAGSSCGLRSWKG